jgi:phospholipid/cholesterol/gamma-HCH transport system permease protein
VPNGSSSVRDSSESGLLESIPVARFSVHYFGRSLIRLYQSIHGIIAFALITLGVMVTKPSIAGPVLRPLFLRQLVQAGLRLLPMILFLAFILGLVIIGQTVSLLNRVGAREYLGVVMVTVVVRELGPLVTALIVLARTGTANVVELGTSRASGEVEALEVLGIDPVHYFVVPRVLGLALGVFSLTVYLILVALCSGWLWAFLQDVPITPGDYFSQLAQGLRGLDFVVLAFKTLSFGALIAVITCYHGLAQPLRIEQVSFATVRAVVHSVVACVLLDALFIIVYVVV